MHIIFKYENGQTIVSLSHLIPINSSVGKNAVHLLHPIFNLGRDENAGKSPYQIVMSKEEEQIKISNTDSDELDATSRRTRSLKRKDSLKRRLESGHSLSESHGNTWPESETNEMEKDNALHRARSWDKRQTNRRNTLKERIEHGNALSNSTGGQWGDNDGGK